MRGAETVVGVDGCWISVELQNGDRAGFDDAEGKVPRALCRGPGTKTRVAEVWVEPRSGSAGVWKPEPGYCTLTLCDEGMQAEGWTIRAVVERGLGSADDDWRRWMQRVGGPCSSPGSSPGCALGLTP